MSKFDWYIKWSTDGHKKGKYVNVLRNYLIEQGLVVKKDTDIIDIYTLQLELSGEKFLLTFDEDYSEITITEFVYDELATFSVQGNLLFLDEIVKFFVNKDLMELEIVEEPVNDKDLLKNNKEKLEQTGKNVFSRWGYNYDTAYQILSYENLITDSDVIYKVENDSFQFEKLVEKSPTIAYLGNVNSPYYSTHVEVEDNLVHFTLFNPLLNNAKTETVITIELSLTINMLNKHKELNYVHVNYSHDDSGDNLVILEEYKPFQKLLNKINEIVETQGLDIVEKIEKAITKFNNKIHKSKSNAMKYLLYSGSVYEDVYDGVSVIYNKEEDSLSYYVIDNFIDYSIEPLFTLNFDYLKQDVITITILGNYLFNGEYTPNKVNYMELNLNTLATNLLNFYYEYDTEVVHKWFEVIKFMFDNSKYKGNLPLMKFDGKEYLPVEALYYKIPVIYYYHTQIGLINSDLAGIYVNSGVSKQYDINENMEEFYKDITKLINVLE